MDVLAQVGSADFFNTEIQGQVDGTRSPRSPGSTLKPFVYALALDQGLIHPLSILADAPRSFGDYNPENFRSEEHTSELQSRFDLVCRLLLEKKKKYI